MGEITNNIEEIITLSLNFREPIGIIVDAKEINGVIEDMDELDRVLLAGEWYRLQDIAGVVS